MPGGVILRANHFRDLTQMMKGTLPKKQDALLFYRFAGSGMASTNTGPTNKIVVPGSSGSPMVDLKGFEPSTSRMRTERSPS